MPSPVHLPGLRRNVWLGRALLVTTLLTLVLGITKRADRLQEGLAATYFAQRDGVASPVRSVIDASTHASLPPGPERRQNDSAPPGRGASW